MKKIIVSLFISIFLILQFDALSYAQQASGISVGNGKYHISGGRTLYHSDTKVFEAFGDVVMNGQGQRLSADYIWYDTRTNDLKARGNVVFVTKDSVIYASELHFNLVTALGSIFYGSVSNDQFILRGQLIRKISEDRFLTTEGEYTTCQDCPETWKLTAKSLDVTIDGYAILEDMYINVNDVPTFYAPYFIISVKTRRQTGLLAPKLSIGGANGFTYLQPLFIALSDHQDITLTLGNIEKRGRRGIVEYNYRSYDEVAGFVKGFFLRDFGENRIKDHRYALNTEHNWPFFKNLGIRWRYRMLSDQKYFDIAGFGSDIPGNQRPAIESNFVSNYWHENFFAAGELKGYRSNFAKDPAAFDGDMVQAGPNLFFGISEQPIWSKLTGNIYARYDRFHRQAGDFTDLGGPREADGSVSGAPNRVYDAFSNDLIRKAHRFLITPELSYSLHLGKFISLVPILQYNERIYLFNVDTGTSSRENSVANTTSRYLNYKILASTTLEKIYAVDGERIEKVKHQITPVFSYSRIFHRNEDTGHPFQNQIQKPGGSFDQFDIVPIDNRSIDQREPVGNAFTLKIFNRLVTKKKREEDLQKVYPFDLIRPKIKQEAIPKSRKQEIDFARAKLWERYDPNYSLYETIWRASIEQSYDLIEAKRENITIVREKESFKAPSQPFSPFLFISQLGIGNFTNGIRYEFDPYGRAQAPKPDSNDLGTYDKKQEISLSLGYKINDLTNNRSTLRFWRAVNFGYNLTFLRGADARTVNFGIEWSFNDFFHTSYRHERDLQKNRDNLKSASFIYRSPSECWRFSTTVGKKIIDQGTGLQDNFINLQIDLNFLGGGNFSSVASAEDEGPPAFDLAPKGI